MERAEEVAEEVEEEEEIGIILIRHRPGHPTRRDATNAIERIATSLLGTYLKHYLSNSFLVPHFRNTYGSGIDCHL
jgi:hypothetical protein